jgi:hypothetical protein
LFVVFLGCACIFPFGGVALFFDASFGVFLLGQIFLIRILSCCRVVVGGFCLESLILAQDERWRRA